MKILINDKMAEEAIQVFKDAGHDVTYEEYEMDTLKEIIGSYDAIMIRSRTKLTKDIIIEGAKGNLKAIGRAGIGVDNVDIETAAKKGIKVVNAPTGATISVAELAIAHMLSLSRRLTVADSTMKNGEWAKKQLKGTELHGKTLGLIGCGNIGVKLAEFAYALDMDVIGYDPYISKEDMSDNHIKKIDELPVLLKHADYISLHIPHIKQTHHILNKEMFSHMKPTAFLINCARGGTVDENALYEALQEGKLAGAALDVFEQEPPEKQPLYSLPNVALTPHIGANTIEGQIRAGTVCAEQVLKVLDDKTPDHWVNKKMMQ
jgi:D-3-phosphoglycerate dehydrogenase